MRSSRASTRSCVCETVDMADASPSMSRDRRAMTTSSSTSVKPFCLPEEDRKSTRLNSSHLVISYAVFCLKKKKNRLEDSGLIVFYSHYTDNFASLSYTGSLKV